MLAQAVSLSCLQDNDTQLSLIHLPVAQSNNTTFQSVEQLGHITSQPPLQDIALATAKAEG